MELARPEYGVAIPGGYFREDGHIYRNQAGTIIPSATQVFEVLGCNDFGGAKQEDIEWKQSFGVAAHAAVEYLAANDLDWDTCDPAIIPAVTGIEQFFKQVDFEVEASEEIRIVSLHGMEYGMRLDLRGKLTYRGIRRNGVIDLKFGSKKSPTWNWQIAGAYTIPLPTVPGGWVACALQCDPEGFVDPHWFLDIPQAQREFQVLLAAAIIKINAGLWRKNGNSG